MRDEDEQPTFSIWWVAGLAVLLAGVGLWAFLTYGTPSTPTNQLDVPRTSSTTTPEPVDPTPIPTLPDGTNAPSEINAVVTQDGSTAYSFVIPEELATARVKAVVANAAATPNPDSTALRIRVNCTGGVGEAVAQIAVSESADAVTVLAVVLTPDDAAPCASDLQLEEIVLPLLSPLGAKQVVVAPPGTEVPVPQPN